MEWFKTNGILDEHILRGIAKYGISRTEKVATLVYLAGGTVFILLKVHVLAVIYFIVGLILLLYPVSYTHLDVYKRQRRRRPSRIPGLQSAFITIH